jgi:hypothetical protein
MATTKKTTAKKTAAAPAQVKPNAKKAAAQGTPDGYVYVSRTVTTVDDPNDDRAPGYVHIPGSEEPRLVDAKSVPELEDLGYCIVNAPPDADQPGG